MGLYGTLWAEIVTFAAAVSASFVTGIMERPIIHIMSEKDG
jgi:hypothetical protein